MNKYLGLLLVLLFISSCSSSSAPSSGGNITTAMGQTVTGTVTDSSGAPLSGATVTLELALIYSTKTDATGAFEFKDVPAGRYPVKASMTAYSTDSETVVVTAGSNSTIALQLKRLFPIVPEAGLVCLYRFSGNVADSSGNKLDGAVAPGCDLVADRFGKPGSALQFYGINGEVTIPNVQDLNFGDSSNFTICFWIKCSSLPASGTSWVLSKMDSGLRSPGYGVALYPTNVQMWIVTQLSTMNGRLDSLVTGTWRFVTVGVNGRAGSMDVWMDGRELGHSLNPALQSGSANDLPLTLGHHFKGALDDVRIYRRVLSFEEVGALYHENGW